MKSLLVDDNNGISVNFDVLAGGRMPASWATTGKGYVMALRDRGIAAIMPPLALLYILGNPYGRRSIETDSATLDPRLGAAYDCWSCCHRWDDNAL